MTHKKQTIAGLFIQQTLKYRYSTLVILALTVVYHSCEIVTPLFYKYFFDLLTAAGAKQALVTGLIKLLLLIGGVYFINWISRFISSHFGVQMVPKIMNNIITLSYENVSGQSYQFFSNNFSGSIVRRIQRLAYSYNTIYDIFANNVLSLIVTCIGSVIILSLRNITIGMIIVGWIIAVAIGNFIFTKGTMELRRKRAAKDSESTAVISDTISGAINVKQFNGVMFERGLVAKVMNELLKLRLDTWNRSINSQTVQTGLFMFLEIVIMYFAIGAWSRGQLTVGDFALIQGIIIQLWSVVWNIMNVFKNMSDAWADAQEGVDLLNTPYDIVDVRNAKKLKITAAAVRFDHVQFNYNETREILTDFSLNIRPKEKIALVGPSGAGKSTIVKILFRYYNLASGKITIDSQDISKVTQESLRDAVAMVPQDPVLFHRSLMDNIRYGKRQATDKEVYEAAKKAHCHEFIKNLPQGYDTFVGERGIKLSGGERQRVAIARAILKNAPILVLDEATSSLDSESEALIHDALKVLMKDKTVIVIAHRLSTIMEMDRIVVVENGKVTDMGTHQELLARAGTYKKLWKIQAGGFIA